MRGLVLTQVIAACRQRVLRLVVGVVLVLVGVVVR
jgi:hypothetical protein